MNLTSLLIILGIFLWCATFIGGGIMLIGWASTKTTRRAPYWAKSVGTTLLAVGLGLGIALLYFWAKNAPPR
ncbi:MAG: hypothetical protein EXR67_00130 [Dehalococcoidia bacterium]|nr:hypothetical protein [Dehalococcoidia bacterium]